MLIEHEQVERVPVVTIHPDDTEFWDDNTIMRWTDAWGPQPTGRAHRQLRCSVSRHRPEAESIMPPAPQTLLPAPGSLALLAPYGAASVAE